jgi:hypothetical protein
MPLGFDLHLYSWQLGPVLLDSGDKAEFGIPYQAQGNERGCPAGFLELLPQPGLRQLQERCQEWGALQREFRRHDADGEGRGALHQRYTEAVVDIPTHRMHDDALERLRLRPQAVDIPAQELEIG